MPISASSTTSAAIGFINIANRSVADGRNELDGKVLTRPALLVSDGDGLTYAVDVDIGKDQPLKNVPLARANVDLIYAEVGNPCRLRRTANGMWEVVGFSKEMPGTYVRFPVSLVDFSFGPVEDLSLDARPLTYEELIEYGGYGVVPYGAVGIFKGGVLLEIK